MTIIKKISLGLIFSSSLMTPLFADQVNQQGVDSKTVVNQLSAPSYFYFSPEVKTIGNAINEVLKATGLHLTAHLDHNIQLILERPLPNHLRKLKAMSVFQAIKTLTGAQIFVITPSLNEISFSFDKNLSDSDLTIRTRDSSLQQYLDRANFSVRVSTPLKKEGLAKSPTRDEVINFNKKEKVYFGFNDKDQIVAIAESQREANALARKDRAVFYAMVGDSLKDTITRWAKDCHYKVVYLAKKNLTIDSPSVFFGTLTSKDGALMQLLSAASKADVNTKAVFTANRVLVIKDNTYSPMFLMGGNDHA